MKIAIITGASSGMGAEFVRQLDAAESFDELWLIARRREPLEAFAGQTRAYIRAIPLDLSLTQSIESFRSLLEEQKPEVAVLVNAAGFGRFGAFDWLSLEEQNNMIDLNVRAMMNLTYVTEPYMQKGSRVYQLASMSSFMPVPWINVYAATKAFVLSFSRALNVEWASKGIRVLAVSPFWVRTAFFDRASTDDTITYYSRIYEAKDVVRRALHDMKCGKDVSVCGFFARAQARLLKILPHRAVMTIWRRQQKH